MRSAENIMNNSDGSRISKIGVFASRNQCKKWVERKRGTTLEICNWTKWWNRYPYSAEKWLIILRMQIPTQRVRKVQ